jgi:protein PhnA
MFMFARMSELPNCPKCDSEYTYEDGSLFVCPDCEHEFTLESCESPQSLAQAETSTSGFFDAYGTPLEDGDTVTVIKDLKVGGTSSTLKIGTKVKNIRLVGGDHDIDCKIKGFGGMKLKTEFVKKA